MWCSRSASLYFLAWMCAFFLMLFGGQTVYAVQSNTNQVQSSQTNSSVSNGAPSSDTNWSMGDIVKIIGGSLLAIVTSLIIIYKFILEKGYDIEAVEIDLINQKPMQNKEHTDFLISNISKEDRCVEQLSEPNPYYLEIVIKFFVPDGRKPLKNIIVKKLIFHMNGYELICVPKMDTRNKLKKCIFNKQKKTCSMLLKCSTIKEKDDRIALNQIEVFRKPNCIDMYIVWYPQIIMSSLMGFLFSKKASIEFEKIQHESNSPRIGIKSKGIF